MYTQIDNVKVFTTTCCDCNMPFDVARKLMPSGRVWGGERNLPQRCVRCRYKYSVIEKQRLVTCVQCGKDFSYSHKGGQRKLCSEECKNAQKIQFKERAKQEKREQILALEQTCCICGQVFHYKRKAKKCHECTTKRLVSLSKYECCDCGVSFESDRRVHRCKQCSANNAKRRRVERRKVSLARMSPERKASLGQFGGATAECIFEFFALS